jgi:hypothetical protein
MKHSYLLSLILSLFLGSDIVRAAGAETDADVDAALKNPAVIKPGAFEKSADGKVVVRLRSLARGGDPRAKTVLLNADDPGIAAECLVDLRADKFSKSQDAARILSRSNRPDLILLLEQDLNRDEPASYRLLGEEFQWERVSVHAGAIIRGIIAHSKQFTPEVEAWAVDVEGKAAGRRWAREVMRIWLAENRQLLQAHKYNAVRPPSRMPPFSLN